MCVRLIKVNIVLLHQRLSCTGNPLWNFDIRLDDNPIEANLNHVCRINGEYSGKSEVNKVRQNGPKKRLCFFTLSE